MSERIYSCTSCSLLAWSHNESAYNVGPREYGCVKDPADLDHGQSEYPTVYIGYHSWQLLSDSERAAIFGAGES